jgi:hypothetical protein
VRFFSPAAVGQNTQEWLQDARLHFYCSIPRFIQTATLKRGDFKLPTEPAESDDKVQSMAATPKPITTTDSSIESLVYMAANPPYSEPFKFWQGRVKEMNDAERKELLLLLLGKPIWNQEFVMQGLTATLNEKQMPELLLLLDQYPDLARLFLMKGWEAQARPVILKHLERDFSRPLSWAALSVAVGTRDPKYAHALTQHVERTSDAFGMVLPLFRDYPGIDYTNLVGRLWRRVQRNEIPASEVALEALAVGITNAWSETVQDILLANTVDPVKLERLQKLASYTGAPEQFYPWLRQNYAQLRFNTVSGVYEKP